MINILTWNIQCGKGVDEVFSLQRIAEVSREMGDADVLCFQEVARHDPALDGGKGEDQALALAALFPHHEMLFGPALNRRTGSGDKRSQMGNLILSRLPVVQCFSHLLPRPASETPCMHMPRQALEVVVEMADGPTRIVTTHLEFHSEAQRLAQIARLRGIQRDAEALTDYGDHAPASGPYAAVAYPARSIVCGDFNATPDDACYRSMGVDDGAGGFKDAWRLVHPEQPHDPTCGIYDHAQWQQGAHCRDYFFMTADLTPRASAVVVDMATAASDHQPVMLSMVD